MPPLTKFFRTIVAKTLLLAVCACSTSHGYNTYAFSLEEFNSAPRTISLADSYKHVIRYNGKGEFSIQASAPFARISRASTGGVSPDHRWFLLNSPTSSGQFSELKIYNFDISSNSVGRLATSAAKTAFVSETGCQIDPEFINVIGVGWNRISSGVILALEQFDRTKFCNDAKAAFLELNLSSMKITEVFSLERATDVFCHDAKYVEDDLAFC